MYLRDRFLAAGCTEEKQPTSTHMVTFWHTPASGCYSDSYTLALFLEDKDFDKVYDLVARHRSSPHMAEINELSTVYGDYSLVDDFSKL